MRRHITSEILLGTCGWSYAEWEGIFYPKKQGKLGQYSKIFPTVEIDSTFYAQPNEGTVQGWVRNTPPGFVFSAKLPQAITHRKRLDLNSGIETDLNQFIETLKPLNEARKLACILIQLPPGLKFDLGRLESFLAILPEKISFAVEFRHNSWVREDAIKLLEKYKVAYTIVDEPLLPPEVHVTSDIAYIRWHGRGSRPWFNYKYAETQLEDWVPKVKQAAEKTRRVLGYFNNHFHGYAPENALQTTQMLGSASPPATAALQRLGLQRKYGKPKPEPGTLDAWTGQSKIWLKKLNRFAGSAIVQAAQEIPDNDFSMREESKLRLAAYVGHTTVDIDLNNHTIIHRCSVYDKTCLEKKFCHHIVKLLLNLKPAEAEKLLATIDSTLDSWKFESRLSIDSA